MVVYIIFPLSIYIYLHLLSCKYMYNRFIYKKVGMRKQCFLKWNGKLGMVISHRAFWSSLSFQLRQRIKLRNQSPVWSNLLTVGRGCWLMHIRTESPLESCCLLFPSNETQALLRASSGICHPLKQILTFLAMIYENANLIIQTSKYIIYFGFGRVELSWVDSPLIQDVQNQEV